ncbi:cytochrome P450 [Roridomyces roridus]|uniref:Cytochrome P450 n=1 Tax=Roridomyces roridus TaxID=1738132 RepID=A0AAD7FC91_9AGAR|nr:cytochrome P450 [Roridomyces roridus]
MLLYLVSHAFSRSALMEFIPLIQETIGVFRDRLDGFCSSQGAFFDALPWFNYLAFDILSDLAFGERIGMLEKGSDVVTIQRPDNTLVEENAISLVDEREHFAAVLGLVHPVLQNIATRMPFLAGQKATSALEELARQHVLKRLESGTRRDDILGKLILARGFDQREPGEEEVRELTAEAVTLLIAGSDTTSNSLAVILHLICTHPGVYEKLLAMLFEVCDGDSYERAKDVPYLQATINEALRIHSITAIGLHRSAPPGGLVVEGRYFEEGTKLSVPAWTTNHDSILWGDPENFRPERWLEDGNLKQYLLAFGKGPRACIGQNLALIEITSIVSMMLLRYKIEVRDSRLETTEGFMHKPVEFSIRLEFR